MVHIPTLLIVIWFTASCIAWPAPPSLVVRTTPGAPDWQKEFSGPLQIQGTSTAADVGSSNTHQCWKDETGEMAAWADKLRRAKYINMWGELLRIKQPIHFVIELERNPTQEAVFSGFDLFFADSVCHWQKDPMQVTIRHELGQAWKQLHGDSQDIYEIWARGFNSYWKNWKDRPSKGYYERLEIFRNEGRFDALGNLKPPPNLVGSQAGGPNFTAYDMYTAHHRLKKKTPMSKEEWERKVQLKEPNFMKNDVGTANVVRD
ncbi:hypothetical protein L208DRAFT_1461404 [Tricholoma matsutake]|nr:hypothetical protein L208DRAFT_1461404 [Tricholoma matsutake 945]